jgi:hypothetical protein
MQADVRSAVTRTSLAARNLISVGRVDEASSHKYAPQALFVLTEGGTRMGCTQRVWELYVANGQ